MRAFLVVAVLLLASQVNAQCEPLASPTNMVANTCTGQIAVNATCTYSCATGFYRSGSLTVLCNETLNALNDPTGTCINCSVTAPTCGPATVLNISQCGLSNSGSTGCIEQCSKCNVAATSATVRGGLFQSPQCQSCLLQLNTAGTVNNATCIPCCTLYTQILAGYSLSNCMIQWFNTLAPTSFWYPVVAPFNSGNPAMSGALVGVCALQYGMSSANYPTTCANRCLFPSNPCTGTGQQCTWSPLAAQPTTCSCKAGYVNSGPGLNCTDVDECQANPCDGNATCTNTPGSRTCTCNSGYSGNGTSCAVIVLDPCRINGTGALKGYWDCGLEYAFGSSCVSGSGCACNGNVANFAAGTPTRYGVSPYSWCPAACGNNTAYCKTVDVLPANSVLQCASFVSNGTYYSALLSQCCNSLKLALTNPCYHHWLIQNPSYAVLGNLYLYCAGPSISTVTVNKTLCPITLSAVCANDARDYTETGPDCGGDCRTIGITCANGLGCKNDTDCTSGRCADYMCHAVAVKDMSEDTLNILLPILCAILIGVAVGCDLAWWRKVKTLRSATGTAGTGSSSTREVEMLATNPSSAAAASSYGEATEAAAVTDAAKPEVEEGGAEVYVV